MNFLFNSGRGMQEFLVFWTSSNILSLDKMQEMGRKCWFMGINLGHPCGYVWKNA